MSFRRRTLLTLLKLADVALITAAFVLAFAAVVESADIEAALDLQITLRDFLGIGAYLVGFHFILRSRDLYRSYRLARAGREFRDLAAAVAIGAGLLLPVGFAAGIPRETI